MNDQTMPGVTPASLIEEYIMLRDRLKLAQEAYEAWAKTNGGDRMKELEGHLLDTLNRLDVDSLKSAAGTVYKKVSTSVTVADAAEFRRHVIGSEEWDLIDWRANKTAVNDMVEKDGILPPGINRTAFVTIGVRRS